MSKRTHSLAESLAARMRAAGVHRIGGARELELRLGRSLTKLERRALIMAGDSRTLKDGAKAGHAARQDAIRQAGQYEYARLPKPPSIDPAPTKARTLQRFSESKRTESLPNRLHQFADGTMRPLDAEQVRKYNGSRGPILRHKGEDIDRKR